MARARVSIIGMGLIGASLGLAIRKAKPEIEVVGHDSSSDAVKQALKLGAIEKSEWNLISACETADVLVIATPAVAVKDIMKVAGPYLQKVQVVTDTAGAKAEVMRWAQELLPAHVPFVGGDPMVGPLDDQLTPRADLFQGATYCLSLPATTPSEAVKLVVGLVELIGANAYFVDPHEHDGYAGEADHLPAVVSAALLRMVADKGAAIKVPADVHRMLGPTFRRATNFSSDDPRTYRDLCLTNKEAIVRWIGALRDSLDEVSALVQEGDEKKLETLFGDAFVTRQVISKPYVDGDQAAQSDSVRTSGSMGLSELFLGRRLAERTKPSEGKKGR